MNGLATDSAGIKDLSFVKQLCSFGKKLSSLVEIHLERAQIEHLIIGEHLAEIRDQRYIHSECIVDSVFDVHSTIEPRVGDATTFCRVGNIFDISRNVR